nr:hypothetical protein [Tanacetum cinerariifolium]
MHGKLGKKPEVFGRFYIASPSAVAADPPPTARHRGDSGPEGGVVATAATRSRATVEEWWEKVAMVSLGRGDECHRSMLMGWRPVAGECGGGAAASPENHRKSFLAAAGRRRRRNLRERRRKDL